MPKIRQSLVDRLRADGFVTVAEASRRTSVHERTIRTWTRAGRLTVRRVGPMLVFIEAASLMALAGVSVCGGVSAGLATAEPVRELTFERDE